MIDPLLLIDLNWSVHDELCGSDHSPIFVNTNRRFENDSIKNWNFREANWIKFENICSETTSILVENFENKQILFKNSQKHLQVLPINVYLRPRQIPNELKTHCQKESSTNPQHQLI